jgi:hypothetical protein
MADAKTKKPVEVGQIYNAKPNTPQSQNKFKTIRIHGEFKDPENPQLVNLWTIQHMDDSGEWAIDSELDLLFTQMIETHFDLQFAPMEAKHSRLEDLD